MSNKIHDDNLGPCCSAEQEAWLTIVDGIRNHLQRALKRPKMSLGHLAGVIELSSITMDLHARASTFDEVIASTNARLQRRKASY